MCENNEQLIELLDIVDVANEAIVDFYIGRVDFIDALIAIKPYSPLLYINEFALWEIVYKEDSITSYPMYIKVSFDLFIEYCVMYMYET